MPPFHHPKVSVAAVHQLTPRRKSGASTARKFVSPDAVKVKEAEEDGRQHQRHRLGEQLQHHPSHQHHPSKLQKNSDANYSSSSDDSDSDEDDDSDDDDSTSSSSDDLAATTTAITTTAASSSLATSFDRASLIASLHPGTNIDGLSDYELLRLQKIQRNEAKLASLGLCGITSQNKSGGSGTGGTGSGGAVVNESAKKAANTRRKNAIQAKKMMELHERSLPHRAARPLSSTTANFSPNYSNPNPIPNPNSRIEQWKTRYSELQSFITKYGSYDVLTRTIENGKYKSLCDWWNRQRKQYTKYKIGVKSTLGDEQIDLLDSLDGGSRAREVGGGGGRGGGGSNEGGGGNTARQLWKQSTDSETDEDEYTWDRINREEEEGDEDYEEDVNETSTEEEEVDIGTVDSYSDQSSRSARFDGYLDGNHVSVKKAMNKNRIRSPHSSSQSKGGKQKRKHRGGSSRGRSSKDGSSVGDGGDILPTRTKRRRGLSIVSSLEKIGPITNVVDNDVFVSNSHHIGSRSRLRTKGSRYADDRSFSSDEGDETEDDEEEDSFPTMEYDEYDPVQRVYSPDSRCYGHRSNSHRQRNREDEYHHRRGRHRWHRPVSEIIITPPEEQYQLSRHRHHRHHRRIHHQQQEHYHHHQHQQNMQQTKEREAILREYGQLYKRQCELQEHSSALMLELQAYSTDIIASTSSASAVPTTTAAAIAAAQASILAAYTTLTTPTSTTTTTPATIGTPTPCTT